MSRHTTPLAVALFEAYSRNCGHNPDEHFDRNAAEQWMTQALEEVGVATLMAAGLRVTDAFRAHGKASGAVDDSRTRQECEAAMVALDEALRLHAEAAE